MSIDYSKEGSIARFAESIRNGTATRNTRFRWREGWEVPNSTGPTVDITAEVLAAAGPETPEEIQGRAEYEAALFPHRLGDDIASDLVDEFCNSWRMNFAGYDFEFDEDAEDDSDLIIVRPDGKRYRIEIDVHVTEMPARKQVDGDEVPPSDDRAPQPWDVPLPLEVTA